MAEDLMRTRKLLRDLGLTETDVTPDEAAMLAFMEGIGRGSSRG
jgi:hypothetical protein